MSGNADLHIHTTYSDGVKTPEEVIRMAKRKGLKAISITDHDTLDGCIQAYELAKKYSIEFITGIELSCYNNGREYHVLGYNIDPDNKVLKMHVDHFRIARLKRAEKILQKLKVMNIRISFDDVLQIAGEAPITRPHIATALLDEGYTENLKQAFNLYIGEGKPAYEAKAIFSVENAIKMINQAGGVSVLAHPAKSITHDGLFEMIEKGLDGIECVHPMHDENLIKFYKETASQYWLLQTGGSDYHGNRDYDDKNFGVFTVPASVVDSIRITAAKA